MDIQKTIGLSKAMFDYTAYKALPDLILANKSDLSVPKKINLYNGFRYLYANKLKGRNL